jgi:putative ABC transport system permease protein
MLQAPHEASNVFIRTAAPSEAIFDAARAEAQAIDEDVPVSDMAVMSQVVENAFRERRLTAILVGVFGAVGVLLATLGVFGTVGYLVLRRSREIGLRLAVGAEARNIVVWVLARGLTPAIAGLALGVGVTAALGRYLQDLLFQTSPFDATAYALACAVVVAAALVACFIPARWAVRVNPAILLREE